MGSKDLKKKEVVKAHWNTLKKLGAKIWHQQIEIHDCVPRFIRYYSLDRFNEIFWP